MKLTITIFILTWTLNSAATNWNWYYVYVETEYIQGTWTEFTKLEQTDFKYLEAKQYSDLFGSDPEDLVHKLFARLKEKKPEIYDFQYQLDIQEDTVTLISQTLLKDKLTLMNEITATLVFNSFKAVKFNFPQTKETWTLATLTLPYFELSLDEKSESKDDILEQSGHDIIQSIDESKSENKRHIWFIMSVILNMILIAVIGLKRKKHRA
jgi:hypothetical protein